MLVDLFFRNIIRLLTVLFIQIFFLNNIHITQYGVTPMWFLIFLLLLPFETPNWLVLITGFALGIILDIFSNTQGVHAFSATLLAFIRPFILSSLAPRDGYEAGMFPRVSILGFSWFLKYTTILVIIHQIAFYITEAFSFSYFGITLYKILIGSLLSIFIIIISQFLIFRK